jgi:hypothetical protein
VNDSEGDNDSEPVLVFLNFVRDIALEKVNVDVGESVTVNVVDRVSDGVNVIV